MGSKKKAKPSDEAIVVEPGDEPIEAATAEEDHEEDHDDDGDEAPRSKTKVAFEGHMQRDEAVAYFQAIVEGLRKGSVEFRRGDRHLALNLPNIIEVEVKASRKGHKHKIEFELSWRDDGSAELSISPAS